MIITESDALLEIVFASEVSELTELFKKHKHLHGSKKFTDALIRARGHIERMQSAEMVAQKKVTRESWDIHKMQWKFLPKEEN